MLLLRRFQNVISRKRFLPDKAVDLVDEAASRLRIEIDSVPEEIDEVERRIIQLQIEQQALEKEEDAASQQRLEKLRAELAELKENANALKAAWQNEKASLTQIGELMEQIEAFRIESEQAKRSGNLGRASELEYGKIPELESQLKTVRKALETNAQRTQMLKEQVGGGRYCRNRSEMDGYPCLSPDGR